MFIVGETNPLTLELVFEDPALFSNVGDETLLVSVDPAGQSHEKKLPWMQCVHNPDYTAAGTYHNVLRVRHLRSLEYLDTTRISVCHLSLYIPAGAYDSLRVKRVLDLPRDVPEDR